MGREGRRTREHFQTFTMNEEWSQERSGPTRVTDCRCSRVVHLVDVPIGLNLRQRRGGRTDRPSMSFIVTLVRCPSANCMSILCPCLIFLSSQNRFLPFICVDTGTPHHQLFDHERKMVEDFLVCK